MNKISIIQNHHNNGFQEMPRPPLFWLGPYRLRLFRLRDRIIPWQVRHFYYHHEAEAQVAFEPVERRLSWTLLQLAIAKGTTSAPEPIVPIYHKELAAVLGVWRETITATLNRWSNEGIITQRPGHIILEDLARLEQLAEEP